MDKQWVFEKLVKHENDFVGFFAYALYKREKSKKASEVRDLGKSVKEIKSALTKFHDTVVNNHRLITSYRTEAKKILNGYTTQVENEVKTEFEEKLKTQTDTLNKQINKLQSDLQKAPEKAEIALIKKVSQIPRTTSRRVRFFSWLWSWTVSGFAGIWAAFVALVGVYLIAIPATTPEDRNRLLVSLTKEIVFMLSESPVSEVSLDDTQGSVTVTAKNPLEASEYVEENTKSNVSHVNNEQLAATKKSKPQG